MAMSQSGEICSNARFDRGLCVPWRWCHIFPVPLKPICHQLILSEVSDTLWHILRPLGHHFDGNRVLCTVLALASAFRYQLVVSLVHYNCDLCGSSADLLNFEPLSIRAEGAGICLTGVSCSCLSGLNFWRRSRMNLGIVTLTTAS